MRVAVKVGPLFICRMSQYRSQNHSPRWSVPEAGVSSDDINIPRSWKTIGKVGQFTSATEENWLWSVVLSRTWLSCCRTKRLSCIDTAVRQVGQSQRGSRGRKHSQTIAVVSRKRAIVMAMFYIATRHSAIMTVGHAVTHGQYSTVRKVP